MDLKDLFIDLKLVAHHIEVRAFMKSQDPAVRLNIEKEFIALCDISKRYDQVRILDNDGMELVRVNYNNGKPAAVPQDQLQNKKGRYYFQESMKLTANGVYVSPFDLNIENGEIEHPLKPMIRVSTPILNDRRERIGIVVLNYLGQQILNSIHGNAESEMQSMLLNSDGYWLLSPTKSQEWAFMYEDRKAVSFASMYPDEWKTIKASTKGQFNTIHGEYTFSTTTVAPQFKSVKGINIRKWKMVCFTPMSKINATIAPISMNYMSIFAGIFIIIVFGAMTRARFVRSRVQGRIKLEQARLAAENANKAKSDFLARMSHEIRTPMNAVIGLTHLALKTKLSPKQQDYLDKVSISAKSLLVIINDILDFSKIEADRLDMDHIDFLLDDVFNNLVSILAVQAEQKELEFLLLVRSKVPNLLIGDPLRLGQVLLNLTGNAIKFTESGEVIISADLVEETKNKAKIRFSIKDTGIGISKDQINTLFQPFSQADGSITRKFGGTGLGLTISKRIVELMGGTMQLESTPGEGSTFSFTIPFELQAKHTGEHHTYPKTIRGMRVLIVDDSKMSRLVLRSIMESFSFIVSDAPNGEEALQLIHEKDATDPFKLIITDWRMPDYDGIELTRKIKEAKALRHPPKVILLTAYGHEEIQHRAEQADLDGFMLKPFNRSILFDTIMTVFGGNDCRLQISKPTKKRNGVPPNVAGAKILLAEDNEINQQVAKEILEGADVTVSIANNGQEALEMLSSSTYDAVLMDIQMPVMDGFQTVRSIRSNPRFMNLPVIAMTAHALVGDKEKSLLSGMNDHITKPIEPDQLMEALSNWLPDRNDQPYLSQVHTPQGHHPDSDFPNLPDINTSKGLLRLKGNETLYAKLLSSFANNAEPERELIYQLIMDKNNTNAIAIIHRLKGVAGNLGAEQLQQLATEVETALKHEEEIPQQLLNRFESEITLVADGINQAFPQPKENTCTDQSISISEVKKIRPQLEELASLLEQHDLEARSFFNKLKPTLSDLAPAFTSELNTMLDKFDFAGSYTRISTFFQQCETTEERDG